MGRGIAQVAAAAGIEVWLFDVDEEALDDAIVFTTRMIKRAAEKGRMSEDACEIAIANINRADNLQMLAGCHLVIEAIVENLEIKQGLFKQLEEIVGVDTILASNTSSLSISAIAAACERPELVAGYHFFNPVPLMGLVEIISGLRTAPGTIDKLVELTKRIDKTAVQVIDSPGFLVNHAGRGFNTEALRILSEQIADVATIDMILRDGVGFRLGPFELMDITALDVSHPVMEQVYHQFYEEPRYRPQPITQRRMNAGLLGRKTNEGFYRYQDNKKINAPARIPKGKASRIKSVYLADKKWNASKLFIKELKARKIKSTKSPKDADICVVIPYGMDCTTAALQAKLPPERTVAVDPCPGFDGFPIFSKLAVVMTNPATDKLLAEDFASLLHSKERPCVIINDSPGFVAQRVLAQIVNVGSEIAQQGLATPEDIEKAVELGLGYPKGPLGLGDQMGAHYCSVILNELYAFYGDPRYRLSPWLKRRALLKRPLLAP